MRPAPCSQCSTGAAAPRGGRARASASPSARRWSRPTVAASGPSRATTAAPSCASPSLRSTGIPAPRTRFDCVPPAVRALRGATTLDADTTEQMEERVQTLLREMLERNAVHHDDIISIVFTATDDLHAMFPATAGRALGLGDLPLLCARELNIEGATPRCVRVLMHLSTERVPHDLRHVYLENARGLNDELRT